MPDAFVILFFIMVFAALASHLIPAGSFQLLEPAPVAQGAAKLKGKLLLTVGEIDSNVDPACTLRVVKALIQAGKSFEYLVLPGLGHGAGESPFAARERVRFFLQHLVLAKSSG